MFLFAMNAVPFSWVSVMFYAQKTGEEANVARPIGFHRHRNLVNARRRFNKKICTCLDRADRKKKQAMKGKRI